MAPAKPPQILSNMNTRQKVTAGIFVLVVIFLLWQIIGLFGGGGGSAPPAPKPAIKPMATGPTPAGLPQGAGPLIPQPAQLPKAQPMPPQQAAMISQREADLMRLQQETESKYIAALNELQMLRVERDIAETNKAIASARLDTVTAEKGIVDLLKPPPITTTYAQGLVAPVTSGAALPQAPTATPAKATTTTTTTTVVTGPETSYSVISVSQLQNKWSAVLGFQGSLFNVSIGDILPPDQAKVIAIDRSGVTLEKNGLKKKFSLVPII